MFAAAAVTNLAGGLPNLTNLFSMRISIRNALILLGLGIVWHVIFKEMGFYCSRRLSSILGEIWDVIKGVTIIAMLLLVVQFVIPMSIINMHTVQFFWLFCLVSLVLSRIVFRLGLTYLRRSGRNIRTILIVGTNKRALEYAEKFHKQHSYGYRVAGFVDTAWHSECPNNDNWCKIVANFKTFSEYLKHKVVDEVFIFLPLKSSYEAVSSIVAASEEQGVTVRIALDFFNLRIAQGRVECIGEETLLTLFTGSMRRKMVLLKEIIDRLVAAFLLTLLLPGFAVVALVIKLTSSGPVFFRQKRVGHNKRIFRIYKFRTMISDAEAKLKDLEHLNEMGADAGAFKIKNDPRVTPIGKILRKYSIDELPQIINVLLGEMSFVGPRPLTERDYDRFNLHRQIRRFSVKPGLTCLWQVQGRNNISFHQWMELDMKYIDEWSLLLDIKILLKTIPAVFIGHGAS
jgi:exopolysaccharide biosynthesis polyprenyl glycosylphosphotransferase